MTNNIKISNAHARVLERAYNTLENKSTIDNIDNIDNIDDVDDIMHIYHKPINYYKNNEKPILDKNTQNRYHKQIFQVQNVDDDKSILSKLYVVKNNNNMLKLQLSSPILNSEFDKKQISKISIKKNFDGSADFIILFDNKKTHYPKNPIYSGPNAN